MILGVDCIVEGDVEPKHYVLRRLDVGARLDRRGEHVARGLALLLALSQHQERARGLDVVVVGVLGVLLHFRKYDVFDVL